MMNAFGKYLVTRAAVHQGSSVYSIESRGKQCTPMAYCAIAMGVVIPVCDWQPERMRMILDAGDKIYRTNVHKEEYFDYTALPDVVSQWKTVGYH